MKMLSTICLLLCINTANWAYQKTGPKMVFETKKHDFGEMRKGAIETFTFTFRNTGDATLKVQNIQADCGCTSPALTKRSFEPGEEGKIPVTLNTTNLAGDVHKNIYVYSNDSGGEKIQLHLDAQIFTPITIEPENAAMNRVPRAGVSDGSFRVSTNLMEKLVISNPSSTLPFLQLNAERIDDKTFELKYSFKGEDVPGDASRMNGIISFSTNSPDQPTASARLILRMIDVVDVKPRLVAFMGKDTKPKTVTLTPASKDLDLKIESFKVDMPAFKVERIEGQPLQLRISLTDKAPEGSFRGNLTIQTNAIEQPTLIVPIRVRR